MEVAKIQVGGTCACAYEKKTIRAGMVGVTVSFAFDEYWVGLNKIAVYRCGGVVRDEYLEGDTGTIPAEVLTKSGFDLEIGVYGTDAEKQIAIPTCWANLGVVRPGADPSGDPAADPSLPIWAQILAKLGNLADLNTEAKENLVAAINEVLTKGGGEVDPEEIGRIVDKHLEKNPPAAYTLPIATETTLGGVKAAAATEEMTQPVCITAEGKLVTVPGQNSGGNVDEGGLSAEASALLITILRNGVYNADQSANITALAAELAVTEEEEPDTPVEPDEPVTPEKTLSSISATYSGGDVTVGTAVSSLAGIVVTAHYSDGTSATVTGYTLSGTIAEGSNTITVSYESKSTTFTVTGVAESGGDTGGTVEVALTDTSTIGFTANAYSDGGDGDIAATALGPGVPVQYTTEYFTEDTEVTITFNATGTILTRKAAAVCVPAAATLFNKCYYYQELGSFNEIIASEGVKYTVRAGHKLYLCQIGGNPSQGTFTVTRAGADGDGVMAVYELTGTEVNMDITDIYDTTAHTWYSDAGETVAENYPTNTGTFVAVSTETFTEDTEVVVEMYHAKPSDRIWAVSYNSEGCHFTEYINNALMAMNTRPTFIYTVRAGYQLMVVSALRYPYEIKVVK